MTNADTLLQKLIEDDELYCSRNLKIRTKEGQIVPFEWNDAQRLLHKKLQEQLAEKGMVRAIVLKGRQQGCSTLVAARFYKRTSMQFGKRTMILTHLDSATQNLFGMVKTYFDLSDSALKPAIKANSGTELSFSKLRSGYKVATAGSKNAGRSDTVQYLHGCLSPETLIVSGTTGKLLRMGDMRVGDLVVTHTGKLAPVTFISEQEKPARAITVRSLVNFPLIATDEHRFFTPGGWKEARDMSIGDEIGYPITRISTGAELQQFRLPDSIRPQGGGSREIGPDSVALDYNWGRMLGLFLAEGTIIRQSKGGQPSAITFAVHYDEVSRTEAWLAPMSACYRSMKTVLRKGCLTATVTVYGRSFAAFVESLCGATDEKRMPWLWNQCGEEFARGLVHGYLCGDGHFSPARDRRISATSIRSAITIGMRDALVSLGYGWAGIAYKAAAVRHGRSEREAFILRLSGPGVEELSREVGKPFVERQRKPGGGKHAYRISDGYVWMKIADIGVPIMQPVMDFEVGHDDHSYCTVHGATHNSEVGFWPNAQQIMAGLGQTVPMAPGSEVILESTANGLGNLFHQMWTLAVAGKSDFMPVFLPWFVQQEYRRPVSPGFELSADDQEYMATFGLDLEQMAWRQAKINTDFAGDVDWFNQEYPATPDMAFLKVGHKPLIQTLRVQRARKQRIEHTKRIGAHVVGLDPARGGDTSTFIHRQGRVAWGLERINIADTMAVAGRAARLLQDDRTIRMLFVDIGGLGAGIYDRLVELGFGERVTAVNFGSKASDERKYFNKRAEMWGELAEWLHYDITPCIPDDDQLHGDLTAVSGNKYSSNGQLKLEPKEKIREELGRSPDDGDALALTFAEPVAAEDTFTEDWRTKLLRNRSRKSAMSA